MTYPSKQIALNLFLDKYMHNAGMFHHSFVVAKIAEAIAGKCGLNTEKAFVLGLLHDFGYSDKEPYQPDFHVRVGYSFMIESGYLDVAKICLTHSFPNKDMSTNSFSQEWLSWASDLLSDVEYDDYDMLIQLSDMLVSSRGPSTYEERVEDIFTRYKISDDAKQSMHKNCKDLKDYFDSKCNCDIYDLLGVK